MENQNQSIEPNQQPAETTAAASTASPALGSIGRWTKRTIYGFAGLIVLALFITVISPETAVAVTQFLPKEYQQTIFASAGSGQSCSAGKSVGSYTGSGCCPSMASSCSSGTSCCPASAEAEVVDETFAVDIPNLSLDTMLAGVSEN